MPLTTTGLSSCVYIIDLDFYMDDEVDEFWLYSRPHREVHAHSNIYLDVEAFPESGGGNHVHSTIKPINFVRVYLGVEWLKNVNHINIWVSEV